MKTYYDYSIIRNGKEIRLSDDEIFEAHQAFEKKNDEEYLQCLLARKGIKVNSDCLPQLTYDYERLLSKGFDEQFAISKALDFLNNQE